MNVLAELMTKQRMREFGLHRLTSSEMVALVHWIQKTIDAVERKGLVLTTIRAISPGGRSVELDDGTVCDINEGQEGIAACWHLGDPVIADGCTMHRLDPDQYAVIRGIVADDEPDSPAADAADTTVRSAVREVINVGVETMNRDIIVGQSFVVQFRIVGVGGGEFYWRVSDGVPSAHEGRAEDPTMLVEVRADEFLDLTHNRLDAKQAYEQGRLRMLGDLRLMTIWNKLFG